MSDFYQSLLGITTQSIQPVAVSLHTQPLDFAPASFTLKNPADAFIDQQKQVMKKLLVPAQTTTTVWDVLETLRFPITNMLYTAMTDIAPGEDVRSVLDKLWDATLAGITYRDKHYSAELIDLLYPTAPQWVKSVFGFVGDVVTDPTTYVSLGASALTKSAGKVAGKGLMTALSKEGAQAALIGSTVLDELTAKLIAEYGGKTMQQAITLAGKKAYREALDFGIQVGIPFLSKTDTLLVRLPHFTQTLKAIGFSDDFVHALELLPDTFSNLKPVKAIRGLFDTAVEWGRYTFIKGTKVAKIAEKEFREEAFHTAMQSVFADADALLAKIDTATITGTGKHVSTADKLDALFDILRKEAETGTLNPELTGIDAKLRTIFDALWDELTARNMVDAERYIAHYYPRYLVNGKTGEDALLGAKQFEIRSDLFGERVFPSIVEAEQQGYTYLGPVASMQRYFDKLNRAIFSHDLVKQVTDEFGTHAKPFQTIREGDFRTLALRGFEHVVIHTDIADALEKTVAVVTRPSWLAAIDTGFTQLTTAWKQAVTVIFPSFHLRNGFQNGWTLLFKDGIGERQGQNFANSVKLFRAKPGDILDTIPFWNGEKVVFQSIRAADLYESLRKAGVHTGKFMDLSLQKMAKNRTILDRYMHLVGDAGNVVENSARVASYWNDLAAGFHPDEALRRVNSYFINYGDLTRFEQDLKKFIPFWSWFKNNTINQLAWMARNPGRYSLLTSKPLRGLDWASESDKQSRQPFYRDSMYINLFGVKDAEGEPLLFSIGLPFQEIGRYIQLERPLSAFCKEFLQYTSPFLRVPVEVGINHNLGTGRQIDDTTRIQVPAALNRFLGLMDKQHTDRYTIGYDPAADRYTAPRWLVYALVNILPLNRVGLTSRTLYNQGTDAQDLWVKSQRKWNWFNTLSGLRFVPQNRYTSNLVPIRYKPPQLDTSTIPKPTLFDSPLHDFSPVFQNTPLTGAN